MTYLRKCGYRSFGANFVHSVPPFKLNYSLCKLVTFFLKESQESFDRHESRDLICILRHAQYNKFGKSVSLKKFQVNVVQALENRAPPYYLGAIRKEPCLIVTPLLQAELHKSKILPKFITQLRNILQITIAYYKIRILND